MRPCCQEGDLAALSGEHRANSVENILISGVPEEEGFFAQLREGITDLTGYTLMHKKDETMLSGSWFRLTTQRTQNQLHGEYFDF